MTQDPRIEPQPVQLRRNAEATEMVDEVRKRGDEQVVALQFAGRRAAATRAGPTSSRTCDFRSCRNSALIPSMA